MESEVQATLFTGRKFGKVKQNLPKFYLAPGSLQSNFMLRSKLKTACTIWKIFKLNMKPTVTVVYTVTLHIVADIYTTASIASWTTRLVLETEETEFAYLKPVMVIKMER